MGWETRTTPTGTGNGPGRTHGPYYVRKERDADGRVRSVYVGAGRVAELGAELDRITAERRKLERLELAATLAPLDDALDALRADAARLHTWRDAYLVATGHRSHRGEWRRRRSRHADGSPFVRPFILDAAGVRSSGRTAGTVATRPTGADPMARKKSPAGAASAALAPSTPAGGGLNINGSPVVAAPDDDRAVFRAELFEALRACNQKDPDADAVGALRELLRGAPAGYFRPFLSDQALGSLACLAAGSNATLRELARAEAERFAVELAGTDAGPLVRAACEHAAAARVVLDAVSTTYGAKLSESHALTLGAYYEKRLTAAQTRYLRALATVAALRRAEGDEAARLAAAEDRAAARAQAIPAGTLGDLLRPPADDTLRARVLDKLAAAATDAEPGGPPGLLPVPRALPVHAGDSLPSSADVELVTG